MAGDLDWDGLRWFLAAASSGTLAGAARELGVEHTTVGRRLAALERALGASLVQRRPDGLRLTPLGEKLLPLARRVEEDVAAAHRLVTSEASLVRLAVPSGCTRLFTPGLGELRRAHPELSLEIVSGARPVNLKQGEADLAIRSGPITDPDLVVRKLGPSGWSLYAAAAYLERHPGPVDPDDLGGHDLIGYDPSLSGVPAARWIEERAGNARIVLRSREMTDMVAAAIGGVGIALLSCLLASQERGLQRLTPKVLVTREFSLVYRREATVSKAVRAVIQFVRDVMREHAAELAGTLRTR